ncbi:MAG TPA: glycosyltransferase family 4 protein, partial [Actinomycetota bacterium]|nr:glycosyltransferase family 4 protein [Actinomycetota bacterium]
MRILLSCPYAWDAPGGVQVHVGQLARVLIDRGHEVLVLAPGSARPTEPFVRVVGRAIRVPYAGTVAPICFSRRSFRRIRRLLGSFEPDVVHVHEPLTPSTSMLTAFASRGPVVATYHAHLERSRLMEAAAPALRTVRRRLSAEVAVSRAAARFLSRAMPGAVEIVPNGVDVARFAEPGPPADGLPPGPRILWVARLDPQKGFPVLVRAFARLAAERDDLILVVVGDGRDRDALGLLSDDDRRRVTMLGMLPHE